MLKMKLRKKLVRSTPIFIQNTSFNILSTLTITTIIIITKVGYEYFACVLLQFVYYVFRTTQELNALCL